MSHSLRIGLLVLVVVAPSLGRARPGDLLARGCRAALGLAFGRIEFDRPGLSALRDEDYLVEIGKFVEARLDETFGQESFEIPYGRIAGLRPWRYRTFRPVPNEKIGGWLARRETTNDDPRSAKFDGLWRYWKVFRPGAGMPIGFVELWTSAGANETRYHWHVRMHHVPFVINEPIYDRTVEVQGLVGEDGL